MLPSQLARLHGMVETVLRGFASAGIDVSPFHYRTRGGAEVDLILEGDLGACRLLPIQIKLTLQSDRRARWLDDRILAIPAASL